MLEAARERTLKLESYLISELLSAGASYEAADALLAYFNMPPRERDIPITTIIGNGDTRLLIWCGDFYYEWTEGLGFDTGSHNYPLSHEVSRTPPESIIIWRRQKI